MKLYYAPGACSIGIHVLLEEIGKPYDKQIVKLGEGEQYKPPYTSVTPKSKVPALQRDDGSVVTEFPVIAYWLARQNPQANLMPSDDETALRAFEAMEYVVGTMHGQGFGRLFRPTNFASEAEQDKVKARGKEIVEKGFQVVDKALAGKQYLGGGNLSIADAALFFVEFWAAKRLGMQLPANCAAHFDRMLARPAVQRVMKDEGFA